MHQQPWNAANATTHINAMAMDSRLTLSWTPHSKERMAARDLIIGDVLCVLKRGFVYEEAQKATQDGYYKYKIQTRTPNSGNRSVGVVAIPDAKACQIKVVTVMWVDE